MIEFAPNFGDGPDARLKEAGYSEMFPGLWLAPNGREVFSTDAALARIEAERKEGD